VRTALQAGLIVAVLCSGAALAAPVPEGGTLRRRVVSADGVSLALYRYLPPGGGTQRPPVLLVPDLGMGRQAFDVEGRGLAPYLAARGRDVFVLEPRGHGQSEAPSGWRLADLVQRDLPAALDAIARVRPGPVDLVGHGYGGTLAMAACAHELQGRIRRVVALSTPVEVAVPNPHVAHLLERGGRLASLGLDPEGARLFELLFARHGKVPLGVLRRLRANGFRDLSPAAAADLLAWMRTGEVPLPGQTLGQRLSDYDRPTLQLVALRNNWAHPEAASPLRELSPRAEVRLRVLSILHYAAEDYTHLSLLHGAAAPEEIFARVNAFLEEPSP
jgi:pimeloyl-ACP methyl ester carboxylesterase